MTAPIDPRRRRRPGPPDGEPVVFAADEQAAVAVELVALTALAEGVLKAEGVRGASELALYFVDEATIADLNERFLGHTGPTDVLAFPIDDDLPEAGRSPDAGSAGPDRPPLEPSEVPLLLGDVLICPVVAQRNAAEHQRTLRDELALLVVHGTLHVLGMDHADEEETKVMQAREQELLGRLHEPG
ncbi:MAG: putative rRNA maturation factor YbeY [Actinomycetia bacterium]|nr:putative rRNA maturation factor YbeY [Actinomycetes bacterium]